MKYANISIERGYAKSKERKNAIRVINIGDYIQIIAIDNLYKKMGINKSDIVYIEYYDLLDYDGDDVILPFSFIYFNPYFGGGRALRFSHKIHPVFLSIHCINGSFADDELRYIQSHEPIGCRDVMTQKLLINNGIDAYIHGCMTATFDKRVDSSYAKNIYIVDIDEEFKKFLPEEIKKDGVTVSHQIYGNIDELLRMYNVYTIKEYVEQRLEMYKRSARLIITSRLHCALPCLAMGIPVIFECKNYLSRFSCLEKLIPIYTEEKWRDIDWNPLPVNCEYIKNKMIQYSIQRIRDQMINTTIREDIDRFWETDVVYYENSYIANIDKSILNKWKKNDYFEYGIWGVTQITDEVCQHIDNNYPHAKLKMVIDDYREIEYKNIKSVKSTEIKNNPQVFIIATGNSSSIAASIMFQDLYGEEKEKHYCSVFDGKYSNNLE